ncbi:alpha/beta hydrolase-fold protein [Streptomyces sp. DSM 44917]|uniref:Acyl-CoA:diacylglycerol acyltransferase n=1 Tax=Streptomyces boetiae TaxID=3075541 RepID=A0ABU2L1X3_9ACTN|nr:alpha/beta hydrolase-fold protein [Streptomyces sp. DSM 44917]MDT0305555.1 alpha/beta hydrolase-fold protein [Streptomyces sp. DSM 44917]
MKRRTLITATTATTATAAVLTTGAGTAQAAPHTTAARGRVRENLPMRSRTLGMDVLYSLYLPPGWNARRRHPYPVLYLLHGATGQNDEWLRMGNAREILDRAIARRRIPPLVVVMPDGRRDTSRPSAEQPLVYWMNDADGGFPWADMFTTEFLPYVEDRYRAGGAAERRGIGGLSMGGFGSLSFAMRAPGTFAAAIGLSVGLRTDAQHVALDMAGYNWRFGAAFGRDLEGEARLNERYLHWNLFRVLERTPAAELSRTAYYLDCGSYDEFFEANADLHLAMTAKGLEHRFMAREGIHEWQYWIDGLPGGLDFLAEHLG